MNQDILATRYASPPMAQIWSTSNRTSLYHQTWLAVLDAQRDVGLEVTRDQIDDYRGVAYSYEQDLRYRAQFDREVAEAEVVTRHDLKAQLEVFDRRAGGHGKLHFGMTSCDVTETTTELQMSASVQLVRERVASVLARLSRLADEHVNTVVVARTHNQPAQYTTLGVRFARCAEELSWAYGALINVGMYPRRGVRGAVGNHVDMAVILGDLSRALQVSREVAGLHPAIAAGQTPSRASDVELASVLVQVATGPGTLAVTLRLMAGLGQVWERPGDGQVGSSAMPHKRNPRYLERIQGFLHLLRGYQTMVSSLAGVTWYEGDVTDSVTRRIALPGMFYTIDGLLSTFCYALDRLEVDLWAISEERERYQPELATGRLLAALVRAGVGREQAHEAIRQAGGAPTQIPGLLPEQVRVIREQNPVGSSVDQIEKVNDTIRWIVRRHPGAETWHPIINN